MTGQDRALDFLYGTALGRRILKLLIRPWFSRLGGRLLDTRLSALAVRPFIRSHDIDMSQCEKTRFSSFNDFFTRRLIPDARPVDGDPAAFISPCDGRLTVWPIGPDGRFPVKGTEYTLPRLLNDDAMAARFQGGLLWLFRLSPDDYHRYIWPVDGTPGKTVRIPGLYHTVTPLSKDQPPVYHENTREYRLIETDTMGPVLMMEVGAMLVGRIENLPCDGQVRRGQEKGHFAFGGSTIILITKKDAAVPTDAIAARSRLKLETPVRSGQRVGTI